MHNIKLYYSSLLCKDVIKKLLSFSFGKIFDMVVSINQKEIGK